jgi:hypothetical protein
LESTHSQTSTSSHLDRLKIIGLFTIILFIILNRKL